MDVVASVALVRLLCRRTFLPSFFPWGADGVLLREPQPNSNLAPGVDLFRIHAPQ